MSNLLDTKLAYDSSDIEHWTSSSRIVHTFQTLCMCMANTSFIEVVLMIRLGDKTIMFTVHILEGGGNQGTRLYREARYLDWSCSR